MKERKERKMDRMMEEGAGGRKRECEKGEDKGMEDTSYP